MPNQYLAVLEDVDGQEVLVSLFSNEEVAECLDLVEDSTYTLVGVQGINMFLSLHDLRKIIKNEIF